MAKKKPDKTEEIKETTEAAETAEAAEEQTKDTEKEQGAEAVDENAEKIKALEAEIAAQKDKYMRLAAEYDNYRKRTANEKLSIYDDATSRAVTELLPVADSITLALANLKDADPEILKGIELISNQLEKSFAKLNIQSYAEIGDEFDPNLHNAISKIDDDSFDSNIISQVFQKGYKIGDKIIRHAMVQVANCD